MYDAPSTFPRLNEPAPDFTVKTTHGDRTLSDYKDKWLILFSHPADFTPVCTTEFIGFAKAADTFKSMNCELLGLSIDSLFSHLAWTRNIQEKFGVKIPFPIIEDIKMEVAQPKSHRNELEEHRRPLRVGIHRPALADARAPDRRLCLHQSDRGGRFPASPAQARTCTPQCRPAGHWAEPWLTRHRRPRRPAPNRTAPDHRGCCLHANARPPSLSIR
jgi:peroxiredoxin